MMMQQQHQRRQRIDRDPRRKRARREAAAVVAAAIVPLDDGEDDVEAQDAAPCTPATPAYAGAAPTAPCTASSTHLVTDAAASSPPQASPSQPPPLAFLCPLTVSIMFDPVLDGQGNSYERTAIVEYLKSHAAISPISRRPLRPTMLVPNHALRELIHQYMGNEWVRRKASEHEQRRTRRDLSSASAPCRYRSRMSDLLDAVDWEDLQGGSGSGGAPVVMAPLRLALNGEGSAAFRCHGVVVVLDVPRGVGLFHLYTRRLVLDPSFAVQRRMLELNFLQGETRGGCLSIRKSDGAGGDGTSAIGSSEVVFSYNDRVDEVSSRDVRNILLNFVETALTIKAKLMNVMEGAHEGSAST